jgi:hypothetical protein
MPYRCPLSSRDTSLDIQDFLSRRDANPRTTSDSVLRRDSEGLGKPQQSLSPSTSWARGISVQVQRQLRIKKISDAQESYKKERTASVPVWDRHQSNRITNLERTRR